MFVERVLKVDDPVGAVSVHGVNGLWGLLALGIFADGTYGCRLQRVAEPVRGLLYGDSGQFLAQLISVGVVVVWAFGLMYVFFKVQDAVQGIRSSAEDELNGLDIPEMGVAAYPDFGTRGSSGEGVFGHTLGGAVPSGRRLHEEPAASGLLTAVPPHAAPVSWAAFGVR